MQSGSGEFRAVRARVLVFVSSTSTSYRLACSITRSLLLRAPVSLHCLTSVLILYEYLSIGVIATPPVQCGGISLRPTRGGAPHAQSPPLAASPNRSKDKKVPEHREQTHHVSSVSCPKGVSDPCKESRRDETWSLAGTSELHGTKTRSTGGHGRSGRYSESAHPPILPPRLYGNSKGASGYGHALRTR